MDIIEKLDDLRALLLPGDAEELVIAEAIAEIRHLRAIAGPISCLPSAADIMEPLRHRIQDGIDAEKALAAAYEADVKAFVMDWLMTPEADVKAFVMDSVALREAYEFKPLPRACSTTSPPQSGSVRAKLWD